MFGNVALADKAIINSICSIATEMDHSIMVKYSIMTIYREHPYE